MTHILTEKDTPRFNRGYRLHHDHTRNQWIIQAPEKALIADPIAAAILNEVDGQRSISTIILILHQRFNAPRNRIAEDVLNLLNTLFTQRILRL